MWFFFLVHLNAILLRIRIPGFAFQARVPSLHYLGYNDIKMAPKKMMEPLFQISSLMHLMVNGAKSEMWGKTHQVWKKKKREKNHETFYQNVFLYIFEENIHLQRQWKQRQIFENVLTCLNHLKLYLQGDHAYIKNAIIIYTQWQWPFPGRRLEPNHNSKVWFLRGFCPLLPVFSDFPSLKDYQLLPEGYEKTSDFINIWNY